jgi:hypothetical protein
MIKGTTHESQRLLVLALCNSDSSALGIEDQWNAKFPWYSTKNPPTRLLGQIFYYTAARYIRSHEDCQNDGANPLIALVRSHVPELSRQYPRTDPRTSKQYQVAERVSRKVGLISLGGF